VYFWIDAGGTVLAYKAGPHADAPFTEEDVVGQKITEVFPADFAPALDRAFREVLRTRTPSAVERAIVIGEDDHDYEARLLPLAKAPNRALEVLMIVRDVTDLRHREQALVEHEISETTYRTLVEDAPTGLCVHQGFQIRFASRAMATMFGAAAPEELVGLDIRSLVERHDRSAFEYAHETTRAGATIARRTYRCRRRDGSSLWVSMILAASTWLGEPCAFITMFEAPQPPSPGSSRRARTAQNDDE
jgi:PAS domain S-box-containing protein